MKIMGNYSFKDGAKVVSEKYPQLLKEIEQVIHSIKAEEHKTKTSKEKTMAGRMLYSPGSLNKAFGREFKRMETGWKKVRMKCSYSKDYYTTEYIPPTAQPKTGRKSDPYREMDFVKDRLGVEVQFGKYSFMVYNVCAKMAIFKNLKIIDVGVEIVAMKSFALSMSTGVSYFEQFTWNLEHRGVADIDIPVLILGIA